MLRLAGAPAEEAPPGLPFQDPRTPLWAGALQTWAAVATDPVGAFTRLDPGDVLARGLLHLASTAATALALCSALLLVLVLTYAPDVDIYIGFWLVLVAPTALQVGAAAFLVLPLHVACVLWGPPPAASTRRSGPGAQPRAPSRSSPRRSSC